jgi:hypothetical protein
MAMSGGAPDFIIPPGHPDAPGNREQPRPSMIDAVCEAAVELLRAQISGRVIVDHFPDNPEQFDFEGYDAAALVLWNGDQFDAAGIRGEQGSRAAMQVSVVLLVRSLRGAGGAYELLEQIRLALQGESLAGSTALRPLRRELERQDEQVFQYRFDFEAGLVTTGGARRAGVLMPRGATTQGA